jgi:glycosyltransferase involved in cell wall biosynthesis
MNELPLVTVAIPFHNSEKFLEFAVLSVLNQTYTNWELILIDDGSKDTSLNIAKKFTDPKISIISDTQNKGLATRLNQTIDLAKGKYYVRMDADDIMCRDRIAEQVAFLEANPEIDVLGSDHYLIDTDNNILSIGAGYPEKPTMRDVLESRCFSHPSVTGKLEWFKKNKYDPKVIKAQDLELWLRTIEKSNFRNLKKPLLFYRSVGNVNLKKYRKSVLYVISILQNADNLSFGTKTYFSVKYFLKIVVYTLLSSVNKIDLLVKKRGNLVSEKETRGIIEKELLPSINKK